MKTSEQLKEEYLKEISSWDWKSIKKEAIENYHEYKGDKIEGEEPIGQCFLGTVFNLTPSGKYYMPFACSNVDLCPVCQGEGELPNKHYSKAFFEIFWKAKRKYTEKQYQKYGKEWKDIPKEKRDFISDLVEKGNNEISPINCPGCEGLGSREAMKDEIYREVLEEIAEKHGMFITNGEGDPCDILAGIVVEGE